MKKVQNKVNKILVLKASKLFSGHFSVLGYATTKQKSEKCYHIYYINKTKKIK